MRFGCLAIAILTTGCVVPFAIPPMRGELGSSTRVGHAGEAGSSSLHAAAGTHIASGTQRRDQPYDIGVGWTFEQTRLTTSHGIYADAAAFIDRTRRTRTSIGGRGELRTMTLGYAAAAKLRIDTEVYTPTKQSFSGSDHCGAIAGAYHGISAVGLFAEAGRVWSTEPDGDAWVATAGVSMRIPSALGIYLGIPGCK
ncbi:MAG: hypothetical protein M3680_16230 [Myxococcota bacterium]|nr:hypothetical protein [Myxococcota bacterium]